MEELMPIINVFVSGLFGLIIALVTWFLANQRENKKFKQELRLRDYKDNEALYVSVLAALEKVIRATKSREEYFDMFDELALISARMTLHASYNVNKQFEIVSDKMYEWSSVFRQGMPSKIGDTGLGMFSTNNIGYRAKADAIYPELETEIQNLISVIRVEIERLKERL